MRGAAVIAAARPRGRVSIRGSSRRPSAALGWHGSIAHRQDQPGTPRGQGDETAARVRFPGPRSAGICSGASGAILSDYMPSSRVVASEDLVDGMHARPSSLLGNEGESPLSPSLAVRASSPSSLPGSDRTQVGPPRLAAGGSPRDPERRPLLGSDGSGPRGLPREPLHRRSAASTPRPHDLEPYSSPSLPCLRTLSTKLPCGHRPSGADMGSVRGGRDSPRDWMSRKSVTSGATEAPARQQVRVFQGARPCRRRR